MPQRHTSSTNASAFAPGFVHRPAKAIGKPAPRPAGAAEAREPGRKRPAITRARIEAARRAKRDV